MYKVLILSFALIACASARPGFVADSAIVETEAVVAKVGEVVHSVPSAVSHQSQTVVHGQTHVVSDIVAPAVAEVRTIAAAPAPVVASLPVATAAILSPSEISYHGAPLLKSIAAASALATPLVQTYAAPVAYVH
ncbi:cuticle protein 19.8-like [Teleopsis dalmanni]|uniref:cuticle protein 19.8-like n=1 Tax=Teleopsis dalmanni TaxID=139649 RepID=UPI0018CE8225|nr:cuticle protein 19.8-like [Teleopsis dalmanni]